MNRREFNTLIGGAAAAWPFAARAQQVRVRRIGVFIPFAEGDPEALDNLTAFQRALERLGWTHGGNLQIEHRWVSDLGRADSAAAELVATRPDAILTTGGVMVSALKQQTRIIPIVFALTPDPVAIGLVANLARPDGNITGFTHFEYPTAGKWLEVLKEIAPKVERALVLERSFPLSAPGAKAVGAIEAVGRSIGVDVSTVAVPNPAEIERAIGEFAQHPNGGLLPTANPAMSIHRKLIVALAAQYRLPASYPYRHFVEVGGLVSYSVDAKEQLRQAASYIDRIFKGEKPGDLPVQAPTKFELTINLRTAKALALPVPESLLARADEVIE